MTRQDGDEVWCGDVGTHAPHQWTSTEGARIGCPGFRHAPTPEREEFTVVNDPISGVTVFWRSEDPECRWAFVSEAHARAQQSRVNGAKAKNAALRRLRDAHPDEYRTYYNEEATALGLTPRKRSSADEAENA